MVALLSPSFFLTLFARFPKAMELAHQRTENFSALSFLYALTGSADKLRRLAALAEQQSMKADGHQMEHFHVALLLGDAEERIKVLLKSGQGLNLDSPLVFLSSLGCHSPTGIPHCSYSWSGGSGQCYSPTSST